MRAAILTETGFQIRELAKPTVGPGEILIKTTACGICSGDVFVYKNRQELAAKYSRLGHEGSGAIAALGADVDDHPAGFRVGDLVTTLSGPAYADYFLARPEQLVKLPAGVDPVYVLGEAIACCVHAAGRFGVQAGDRVAIVGCGFMGLVCLQLARHQGAGFIAAIDPLADRRPMSQRFGADVTWDPAEATAANMMAQGGEFDVVIEAAGTQSAVDLCTELVKQHGRIILVGYHQSHNGQRTVNMQQWNFKAIDVVNGHVRRQDEKLEAMGQGVELIRQGHLDTRPLVSTYHLSDTELAFQALAAVTPGLFKGVLLM
jgi:threonine dehydrogenase-like Zn-dependent dehydrogenase